MLRRLGSALLVATCAFVAVGIAAPAHALDASDASDAGSFLQQINADRAKAGRAPLIGRDDLAAVALAHARRMATKNSLYHNPSLTSQVSGWRAVGENVGMGGNTRVLHAAFMNSPAHRANILDVDYTEIGLGVTVDSRGVMWVTEVFRQPMRSASTAARVVAAKATAAPKARTPRARASARRPAAITRPARKAHAHTSSAWLLRLSSAASSPARASAGALPHAVDYLRVVAG